MTETLEGLKEKAGQKPGDKPRRRGRKKVEEPTPEPAPVVTPEGMHFLSMALVMLVSKLLKTDLVVMPESYQMIDEGSAELVNQSIPAEQQGKTIPTLKILSGITTIVVTNIKAKPEDEKKQPDTDNRTPRIGQNDVSQEHTEVTAPVPPGSV